MWNNEITRQLAIKLPFVGAGMAIVGSPELTAAVSNAGGVGLFCLGPGAPEMLGNEIDSIRRLSSAPFGVDFIVEETGFGPATTEAHVEVAIAKHVPLAVFFWNPPEERWMRKLKRAGIKVWGTAYSVESARRLKMLGADAVIVQSQEAGGHVKSDLGAMSLVPAVVDAMGRSRLSRQVESRMAGRPRPRSCSVPRLSASAPGCLRASRAWRAPSTRSASCARKQTNGRDDDLWSRMA